MHEIDKFVHEILVRVFVGVVVVAVADVVVVAVVVLFSAVACSHELTSARGAP